MADRTEVISQHMTWMDASSGVLFLVTVEPITVAEKTAQQLTLRRDGVVVARDTRIVFVAGEDDHGPH